jgi:hypothetical protein
VPRPSRGGRRCHEEGEARLDRDGRESSVQLKAVLCFFGDRYATLVGGDHLSAIVHHVCQEARSERPSIIYVLPSITSSPFPPSSLFQAAAYSLWSAPRAVCSFMLDVFLVQPPCRVALSFSIFNRCFRVETFRFLSLRSFLVATSTASNDRCPFPAPRLHPYPIPFLPPQALSSLSTYQRTSSPVNPFPDVSQILRLPPLARQNHRGPLDLGGHPCSPHFRSQPRLRTRRPRSTLLMQPTRERVTVLPTNLPPRRLVYVSSQSYLLCFLVPSFCLL